MFFCSLASGSEGNCHFVKVKDKFFLIDCGITFKYIKNALKDINEDIKDIYAIFISHSHSDHVKGLNSLLKKTYCKVYMTAFTYEEIKEKELKKGNKNNLTLLEKRCEIIKTDSNFMIEDVEVNTVSVSHDVKNIAISFKSSNKKVSIITDLGFFNEGVVEFLIDSNLILLEANHDEELLMIGKYPYKIKKRISSDIGHLSNEQAANLIIEVYKRDNMPKNIVLGHLSKNNNTHDLALKTVEMSLKKENIDDIEIDISYQDIVGKVYNIR